MTSVLAHAPAAAPGKAGLETVRQVGAVRGARAVPDPFLLTTGMMEQEEPYQWPPHSHDEHELIWSARGVVTILVDGRMWSVLPGTGLWIPRGVVHEGHMGGGVASRVTLFSPEAWTRGWKNTTAVKVNEAVQQLLVHLANTGMPAEERLRAQQVCIDMLEPVGPNNISVPVPMDQDRGTGGQRPERPGRRPLPGAVGTQVEPEFENHHADVRGGSGYELCALAPACPDAFSPRIAVARHECGGSGPPGWLRDHERIRGSLPQGGWPHAGGTAGPGLGSPRKRQWCPKSDTRCPHGCRMAA